MDTTWWMNPLVEREIDIEMVQAARNGDPSAWDFLFQNYQRPLFVFISKMISQNETARDLLQETFVSAIHEIHRLRDDARFGSWLFGIAHQLCLKHFGKHQRRKVLEEKFNQDIQDRNLGSFSDAPDSFLIRDEEADRLHQCLAEIPESHRAPILLHWLEDFNLEEIADIMDLPIGTVKSRIHKAKSILKSKLQER